MHEKGFEQLFNEGKDNYFLLITRERKFCSLPIHRDAFYKLHCSGKYYIFKPLYEFRKTQNKVDVLVSDGYTQEVWDMMTVEEKEEILRMIDNMKGRG